MNKINYIKRALLTKTNSGIVILSLLIVFLCSQASILCYGETFFSDVPSTHWIHPILQEMLDAGIIIETEKFGIGTGVTENQIAQIIQAMNIDKKLLSTYDSTKNLTRSEALSFIFKLLEYDKLALQLKDLKSPFIDTVKDSSMYLIATEFGLVSINNTKTFRPDSLIKKEEAFAILNNVFKGYNNQLDLLHSYYAISSYSQIEYTEDLNSLSFGWSRFEFNADKSDVILNMTSTNANEYRVPSGYASTISETTREDLTRQLMVFVKNETSINNSTGKSMTLTELIISDEKLVKSVIESIMNALKNNSYKIQFDGVVIDFEGLKGTENANKLNEFLKKLDLELEKSDLKLYVAVHPQRKAGLDYYNGYDFKTIGDYADYVVLMAHDYYPKKLTPTEMATGFTVTPLAPINEVYYALSAIVNTNNGISDRSKILLQLSMDTAQWKVKNGIIQNALPYHPTYAAISSRIDSGATIIYSSTLQSPYLNFTDLDGTKNVVWYEDERSIQSKIDLAKFFKIGGISIWRLGTIPDYESTLNTSLKIWDQIIKNIKME